MPNFQAATHKVLQIAIECRTAEIAEYISIETQNIVQSGPFKGMILPLTHSWGTGDIAPKLLGTYECELHPAIEKAIARNPEVVFNVGAAEGYYAVGLARRLPGVQVFAFDKDAKSSEVCMAAQELNGVPRCAKGAFNNLSWLSGHRNTLIVMDIEGEELIVLDDTDPYFGNLKYADLIVECHDFKNPSISETLVDRFSSTHDIAFAREGPRNPHAFPILQKLCSLDKSLATSENRPQTMSWIIAWAKERV